MSLAAPSSSMQRLHDHRQLDERLLSLGIVLRQARELWDVAGVRRQQIPGESSVAQLATPPSRALSPDNGSNRDHASLGQPHDNVCTGGMHKLTPTPTARRITAAPVLGPPLRRQSRQSTVSRLRSRPGGIPTHRKLVARTTRRSIVMPCSTATRAPLARHTRQLPLQ